MLAHQLRAQHPPQKTEGGIRDAVGAGFARLAVVVKQTAADIVNNAVKVVRHGKAADDLNVGAQNLQQRGGKNIVCMEFSAVGKAFCGDLHSNAPFIQSGCGTPYRRGVSR